MTTTDVMVWILERCAYLFLAIQLVAVCTRVPSVSPTADSFSAIVPMSIGFVSEAICTIANSRPERRQRNIALALVWIYLLALLIYPLISALVGWCLHQESDEIKICVVVVRTLVGALATVVGVADVHRLSHIQKITVDQEDSSL
jgi:amino acid transporter